MAANKKIWDEARRHMVETLRDYGIRDERILEVMGRIPRHLFIPEPFRNEWSACEDHASPIGFEQTISQPYIVAYMTEKLGCKPGDKVLEIGTGSGYQAAVLAALGVRVYTVEVIPALASHARAVLCQQGLSQLVQSRVGDGYQGWPEEAPFDAVIVTCAPEAVPDVLVNQLREGGVMVVPTGPAMKQRLVLLRKENGRVKKTNDLPVMFVPMVHAS
jgi:protein-L-isoaspartate(D-aspartate) O-methyltransferase